ncbi:hypothetical protein ACFVAD_01680 [Sutcliffiella sp. NPDC057660]|uniref:hypothetical protein n=1 Tax=Sutcliffiella sp. NPDC057660 TaxID=3346199 RepID=UPI0036ADF380
MKKCIVLTIFCFTLFLTACSQSEEDKEEYSGIISDGEAMGYQYSIAKEQNTFTWQVGYKGDISSIIESIDNEDDLENFMSAVSDCKVLSAKFIISASYLLIIVITAFILYRKNRKILKEGSAIITILAVIAIYTAFWSSVELSRSIQDAKYYYLILTNY